MEEQCVVSWQQYNNLGIEEKTTLRVKQLKIGLSKEGLLAVILIVLPNIVYMLLPSSNTALADSDSSYWIFNVLENIGRYGLMLTLIFIQNKRNKRCGLWIYSFVWSRPYINNHK